ncbi:galactose-1-phosphate uridylyltransferase [Clostridium tetani]|uniref:Galactose-1-phosphate uridylyltransferase n=1 Tax=Clostridium tetani TaxID=1513 RepID=A0A4Q0VG01_CLOTA|nr:UDP-glucose--hexose-1-phosphate uridylyltransferase [Clostridium tetani]RXI50453.1 galactose-1-phosphate uridylyltransferase [Clostridium tetani]BDR66458.1 galactose-1-phosphate uridylyltransferase [Clostridium tetani]BDR71959.1 galactose-1-phosphate uridylyltransferase [Clostridium tetani]BDR80434.1 galactose-1-phosphate uridylyltransferase [Clostridium tetani]BDR88889.1 galactose-1-phosphate uridylyltransferase [Clostridium tetani]
MIDIKREIERLLIFGKKNNLIEEIDKVAARNSLLELFKLDKPYKEDVEFEDINTATDILNNMLKYAIDNDIIEDTGTNKDLFDTRIMGVLTPRASEIVRNFYNIYHKKGAKEATNYFYNIAKALNYIRCDRINKNLSWKHDTDYGDMEITINLSKPEKDSKDIAKAKNVPQISYPKCPLCLENVGYKGRLDHPARQNHRVIPVELEEEKWYLQYSPYVYYKEHSILFYEKHVPMKISNKTFHRFLCFIEKFPHYFIGSNADLPIVGGSILNHEHFQGGNHVFPMEKALIEEEFHHESFKDVKLGIVKWPMSVIRLTSKNKDALVKLCQYILSSWRNYDDEELDILSYSLEKNKKIPHNTITPISRLNYKEEFEMDLVLRNNRANKAHPEGIFHPHKRYHNIKKENIGLIEVMGLAVLPGRLKEELNCIEKILMGNKELLLKIKSDENIFMKKHLQWIEELLNKYGDKLLKEEAENVIKEEVGEVFTNILKNAGVFKRDEKGKYGFIKFIRSMGFIKH